MPFEITQKPDHHRADIVRLQAEDFHPHTNADNLVIIRLGGYQIVTRKDEFKPGDLGVFIQPDSVVPESRVFSFLWNNQDYTIGAVPVKKRRITVRRFRGEWSEGLLLPISDVLPNYGDSVSEGQDVSDIIGITHYVPEEDNVSGDAMKSPRRKRYPKTFRGWVKFLLRKLFHRPEPEIILDYPVYDINAYKRMRNPFAEGERVIVTEKIHGSNARFVYVDGTMYAGSHYQWKSETSSNIFRRALQEQPWIQSWCQSHEGHVLYGEVTPTQKNFDYGTKSVQFFVFDIRTPDGRWVAKDHEYWTLLHSLGVLVPTLYRGPFNKDLITEKFVGGASLVEEANHIREGVVICTESGPRKVAKLVSNAFLEKDSK